MMQRLIWAVVALLAGSVGPGRADDGFAYTFGSQGGGDGQFCFPAAVAVWYFRGRPIARGVSVLCALATSACERRWIGPKRARVLLRGRPISEKALVILECKEAFANTELSPLNARLSCRGRLQRR